MTLVVPDVVEERRKDNNGEVFVVRSFQRGALLGKGGFAKCFAFTCHGRMIACKCVSKDSLAKPKARSKVRRRDGIPHPARRETFPIRPDEVLPFSGAPDAFSCSFFYPRTSI